MAERLLSLGTDVAICRRRKAGCDQTAAAWRQHHDDGGNALATGGNSYELREWSDRAREGIEKQNAKDRRQRGGWSRSLLRQAPMRAVSTLALLASVSLATAATPCLAPGEAVHWRVDYCMLKLETDDEIAVSGCIEEEGRQRFPSSCASNAHFKKQMCELMIENGTRAGTLDRCLEDQTFMGPTVRNGGVGG